MKYSEWFSEKKPNCPLVEKEKTQANGAFLYLDNR
jgi:hypothetical protein